MTKISKPQLVVLSAPSGAGKTTICRILANKNHDFKRSVSATTRNQRPPEKDGVDYYFLSEDEFLRKTENHEFLEQEIVHGYRYGTLKSNLSKMLKNGFTVLFDIDVNGALNIKKHYPQAILIFIRPPSLEELKRRLRSRKTDDPTEIEIRLNRLPEEYGKAVFFDYDIINEDLETTVDKINRIVRDHQKRTAHVSNE